MKEHNVLKGDTLADEVLDVHANIKQKEHIIATIKTITNPNPHLITEISHKIELPELCPISHNPKQGSVLAISYVAGERILEFFSLDKHIASYIGHTIVRDMEHFVQVIALNCHKVLGCEITVHADIHYNMVNQRQSMRVVVPQTL